MPARTDNGDILSQLAKMQRDIERLQLQARVPEYTSLTHGPQADVFDTGSYTAAASLYVDFGDLLTNPGLVAAGAPNVDVVVPTSGRLIYMYGFTGQVSHINTPPMQSAGLMMTLQLSGANTIDAYAFNTVATVFADADSFYVFGNAAVGGILTDLAPGATNVRGQFTYVQSHSVPPENRDISQPWLVVLPA